MFSALMKVLLVQNMLLPAPLLPQRIEKELKDELEINGRYWFQPNLY